MTALAEAEVKVELDAAAVAAVCARLAALGFRPGGTSALTDYYLAFARVPQGGYDFTRLRLEDAAAAGVLTEKRWIETPTGRCRLEEERPVSAAEAAALRAAAPDAAVLHKTRAAFTGVIAGRPATLALDTLTLRGAVRHFLEVECLVPPEEAAATLATLRVWLTGTLGLPALREAPSMLELLLGA